MKTFISILLTIIILIILPYIVGSYTEEIEYGVFYVWLFGFSIILAAFSFIAIGILLFYFIKKSI